MSRDYLDRLLARYKRKGVIVDTNLLLIYFIGKYTPDLISKFKKTYHYTIEDFIIIENIMKYFTTVITSPNILTEISNLSNQLPENIKNDYFKEFKRQVYILKEEYIESNEACKLKYFNLLGLTDSVIFKAAKGKYLVFTDDFKLSNILNTLKIDVLNLNHIRTLQWFGH